MKTHFSTPQNNMMSDQDMSGTGISSKPSSRIFQPIQLKGVELPVLFSLCICSEFVDCLCFDFALV